MINNFFLNPFYIVVLKLSAIESQGDQDRTAYFPLISAGISLSDCEQPGIEPATIRENRRKIGTVRVRFFSVFGVTLSFLVSIFFPENICLIFNH